MENKIIKIWVCQECGKEYVDRPIACTSCGCFELYLKYSGILSDTDELTKLIEPYKYDELDKNKRTRM